MYFFINFHLLKSASEKLKEMQRELLDKTKTMNIPEKPNIEKSMIELELSAAAAALKTAQDSSKYWEEQYYAKFQNTTDGRNIEKAMETIKKQFNSELEYLKNTNKRLDEENKNLTKTIEKMKEDYKKSERENLSATYGKVRELENEISALYNNEQNNSFLQVERQKQKLEEELETRTRHFRRIIAEKESELNDLKNNLDTKGKSDQIIISLKNQIQTLKEENISNSRQITILKKELAAQEKYFQEENKKMQNLYEKESENARIQTHKITEIIETKSLKNAVPEDSKNLENEIMLIEAAAKEKISVLEKELELQDEHSRKIINEKDNTISILKEKITESEKEIELLKRNVIKLQHEINEINVKLNKDTYEKKVKDMKILELSQRMKNSQIINSSPDPSKSSQISSPKKESLSEILNTWKRYYDDDNIKCDLLLKIIQNPELKNECVSTFLQQYLLMLYQAFTSDRPILYEAATICLNELINLKKIEPGEFKALCCELKIISSLTPQRTEESESAAINRHSASIGVLCYMDNINLEWGAVFSEKLKAVNGLATLKFYIENFEEFEGIAAQAAQVTAYIGSYKENMGMLVIGGMYNVILNVICLSKNIEIKRNAAECLAILIKDAETRSLLEEDERVEKLVLELIGQKDQLYQENLLLCFVNLSVSRTFKILLYDNGLIDAILPMLPSAAPEQSKTKIENPQNMSETSILYALKIAANMSYPASPASFLPKLIVPVSKALNIAKNPEVIQQALMTIQKLVEDDAGKFMSEYSKFLMPVLISLKNVDDFVIEQALKTLSILCKNTGSQLLNEANIKGEAIKYAILYYCTHEKIEVILAAQNILLIYCENGYTKDIGINGKITFLEKILTNIKAENNEIHRGAMNLLSFMAIDQNSREKILSLGSIHELLTNFMETLFIPTPLSPDESYFFKQNIA